MLRVFRPQQYLSHSNSGSGLSELQVFDPPKWVAITHLFLQCTFLGYGEALSLGWSLAHPIMFKHLLVNYIMYFMFIRAGPLLNIKVTENTMLILTVSF